VCSEIRGRKFCNWKTFSNVDSCGSEGFEFLSFLTVSLEFGAVVELLKSTELRMWSFGRFFRTSHFGLNFQMHVIVIRGMDHGMLFPSQVHLALEVQRH
jgi:hypothetical protein